MIGVLAACAACDVRGADPAAQRLPADRAIPVAPSGALGAYAVVGASPSVAGESRPAPPGSSAAPAAGSSPSDAGAPREHSGIPL